MMCDTTIHLVESMTCSVEQDDNNNANVRRSKGQRFSELMVNECEWRFCIFFRCYLVFHSVKEKESGRGCLFVVVDVCLCALRGLAFGFAFVCFALIVHAFEFVCDSECNDCVRIHV